MPVDFPLDRDAQPACAVAVEMHRVVEIAAVAGDGVDLGNLADSQVARTFQQAAGGGHRRAVIGIAVAAIAAGRGRHEQDELQPVPGRRGTDVPQRRRRFGGDGGRRPWLERRRAQAVGAAAQRLEAVIGEGRHQPAAQRAEHDAAEGIEAGIIFDVDLAVAAGKLGAQRQVVDRQRRQVRKVRHVAAAVALHDLVGIEHHQHALQGAARHQIAHDAGDVEQALAVLGAVIGVGPQMRGVEGALAGGTAQDQRLGVLQRRLDRRVERRAVERMAQQRAAALVDGDQGKDERGQRPGDPRSGNR